MPVLKPTSVFVEQMRCLLTRHGGRLPLDGLEALHVAEFGRSKDPDVQRYIRKKLPHFCFHVVNLASHRWAVWAPLGHPYSPQRWRPGPLLSDPAHAPPTSTDTPAAPHPLTPPPDPPSHSLTPPPDPAPVPPPHPLTLPPDPDRDRDPTPTAVVAPSSATERVDQSTSFVDDLVDLSETNTTTTTTAWEEAVGGVVSKTAAPLPLDFSILDDLETTGGEWQQVATLTIATDSQPMTTAKENLIDLTIVPSRAAAGERQEVDYSTMPPLCTPDVPADDPPSRGDPAPNSSSSFSSSACVLHDESPFNFLKEHPDLIAELSDPDQLLGNFVLAETGEEKEGVREEDGSTLLPSSDDLRVLAEVLTLQRLQELSEQTTGGPDAAAAATTAAPTLGGVSSDDQKKEGTTMATKDPSFDELSSAISGGPGSGSGEVPVPPQLPAGGEGGQSPPDYLQSGLSPQQVLGEMQLLKERSGGVLRPEQMEPFLDYFGELSSRELDRIESLEGEGKPKNGSNKKGGGSGGGGGRAKRNMAIRFPSQQQQSSSSQAVPTGESRKEPSGTEVDLSGSSTSDDSERLIVPP